MPLTVPGSGRGLPHQLSIVDWIRKLDPSTCLGRQITLEADSTILSSFHSSAAGVSVDFLPRKSLEAFENTLRRPEKGFFFGDWACGDWACGDWAFRALALIDLPSFTTRLGRSEESF